MGWRITIYRSEFGGYDFADIFEFLGHVHSVVAAVPQTDLVVDLQVLFVDGVADLDAEESDPGLLDVEEVDEVLFVRFGIHLLILILIKIPLLHR